MGASGWIYFVPYQRDITEVFRQLQEDVFHRGEYFKPGRFLEDFLNSGMLKNISPEFQASILAEIEESQLQKEPGSIDELRLRNAEMGTHSILDIPEITSKPGSGLLSPLTSEQLIELFGTEMPTREMVEDKLLDLQLLRDRGEGSYIVLYKDDVPHEIVFVGFSGD
jgi:hypothetical protein